METILQDIAIQQYNGEAQSTLAYFQEQFQSQYEEGHLVLACHAAFPILLTPDLLYKIWLNFGEYPNANNEPRIIKRIAVSDILLSPLCKEVGREQYEMQADIRFVLLAYLQQYFGKERLDELAHFLLQYVQTYHTDEDSLSKSFRESQEWTALVQLNPNLAAQKIAQSFADKKGKTTEQLRLNLVVERIVRQVESTNEESISDISSRFRTLLEYGKGLKEYHFGNKRSAIKLFKKVTSKLNVRTIKLPVPNEVYRKINLFKKNQIASINIENQVGAISIPGIVPEIGVTFINPNRMLLVTSLLEEGPFEAEIVPKEYTGSLKKLFEYFKPSFEIVLEIDSEGREENTVVQFDSIKDFHLQHLAQNNPLLQKLALKEKATNQLLVQLSKSKKFKAILADSKGQKKIALVNVLKSILNELS